MRRSIWVFALAAACMVAGPAHASSIQFAFAQSDLTLAGLSLNRASLGISAGLDFSAITFRTDFDQLMLATYNGASASQNVYALELIRSGGHISGFSAVDARDTLVANTGTVGLAPESLVYAPNGTLLMSLGPDTDMWLGQFAGRSQSFSQLTGIVLGGALAYVPAGFSGAGTLKAVSSTSDWYDISLTNPVNGIFSTGVSLSASNLANYPTAFTYVAPAFASSMGGVNRMLVADYSNQHLDIYGVDANGNPTTSSGTLLENAAIVSIAKDPFTNDIVVATATDLYILQAVIPPNSPAPPPASADLVVPEPATTGLLLSGVAALAWFRRRCR